MEVEVMPRLSFIVLTVAVATAQPAMTQSIPRDEAGFTKFYGEVLQREVKSATVTIKGPLTLSLGTDHQVNVDQVFRLCNNNSAACPAALRNHVMSTVELWRESSAPPDRKQVKIVVRSAEILRVMEKDPPLSKPLAGNLIILPVLDRPRSVGYINGGVAQRLGLSADEIFTLGQANFAATIPPLQTAARPVAKGQIGHLKEFADPSRLALHESWAPIAKAQGGTLLVMAPATNALLYISEDTHIAIDAMLTFAKQLEQRALRPLSRAVLKWTPAGWEVARKEN